MTEPERKRGRTHDAEGARQAILNAAEEVFAEHGFDGARVDVIAKAADYNKSLIFQYFHDKLGLYAATIRRVDEQTRDIQTLAFSTLTEDIATFTPDNFRTLLKTYMRAYFDYLIDHPRITRILLWEMAEGWQTYAKIITERDRQDVDQFIPLLEKVRSAGLLHSDFNPMAQMFAVEFLFPCYLACLPLYQILLPGEKILSNDVLVQAREYLVDLVARGMIVDDSQPTRG